jgi:hypothetical protein
VRVVHQRLRRELCRLRGLELHNVMVPSTARSVHGEKRMPAAGTGSLLRRAASMHASARPPPAESPAKTMSVLDIPSASSPR